MLERLLSHLNESMNVDGDIIEFGVFRGETFKHLVAAAMRNGRIAYGIDSFKGMGEPSPLDWNENNTMSYPRGKFDATPMQVETTLKKFLKEPTNYEVVEGSLPNVVDSLPDTKYAFAYVDLVHYTPTKEALNYLWKNMAYGSTVYFNNYYPNKQRLCSLAIGQFIKEHDSEIIVSRQMMINGNRETQIAVKCIRKAAKPVNYVDKTKKRPLVVALLLKTGGDYTHEHVNNIAKSIKENLTIEHKLYCFTDNSQGFNLKYIDKIIPFKHKWHKWWGKIEMFRPDVFSNEQVLYFDLDTFIVDNINELGEYDGEFSALRDFYHLYSIGSGVMSWNACKMHHVYSEFLPQSQKIMNNYQEGDQRWIDENKKSVEFFQDLYPKRVVSYKVHCKTSGGASVPDGASVICFHGQPRPHSVKEPEIKKYWNP